MEQTIPTENEASGTGHLVDTISRGDKNQETGAAFFHTTVQSSPTSVLLKTAVASVCSNGTCVDANILMDEGAQRSFITNDLAESLQLKRDGNDVISLSSFGDAGEKVQRVDTATVNIVADDGEKIPIRVLVVPVIAKPLSSYSQ